MWIILISKIGNGLCQPEWIIHSLKTMIMMKVEVIIIIIKKNETEFKINIHYHWETEYKKALYKIKMRWFSVCYID